MTEIYLHIVARMADYMATHLQFERAKLERARAAAQRDETQAALDQAQVSQELHSGNAICLLQPISRHTLTSSSLPFSFFSLPSSFPGRTVC